MKYKKIIVFGLAAALLGFAWSCDKDDDKTEPTPTQQEDNASGAVTSEQEATIETPGGAALYVPEGAVPRLANGNAGTIVFSIETDDDYEVNLPAGETMDSRLYRMGPEGFTFERAITVEIPLLEDRDPGDMVVNLYRIDPTTGDIEMYAGEYDRNRRTVSAQTYHFSPWFLSCSSLNDSAWGCAFITNNSDKWVSLCVDTFTLAYPTRDQMPSGGFNSLWAPWDHNIGVTNRGEWWLPQGEFTICAQYSHDAGLTYTHRILPNHLIVDNAARGSWNSTLANWDCTQYEVAGSGIGAEYTDGPCPCIPIPTTPVGTGDIQVTLTWWNVNSLDLDLWVTDPTGEKCYYGNHPSSTGGDLDRDNLCSNYENGRPENIYWTTTPPAGEYIVEVDWYSSCGHDHGSQAFNVRTVVGGVTNTYSRTIAEPTEQNNWERTMEVCRFTLSGGAATFAEGQGPVDRSDVPRPAKN